MGEVTSRRIEANRRNAQKSTGPRTEEGKDRSRFNALKHGMRAKSAVLPGEDASAYEARLSRWNDDLGPRDDVERFLVRRAVQVSWQLDRIERLQAARRSPLDRVAGLAEEVTSMGARLFRDRRGPSSLYPHGIDRYGKIEAISWNPGTADDPDDPARLVLRLESSAMGAAWLLDRWAELRQTIDSGDRWQPPDRFRAIRLLGRQPIEALEDERVRAIYLACAAMEPGEVDPLADLAHEMEPRLLKKLRARLNDRLGDHKRPVGVEAGRAILLIVIDQEIERLEEILAILLEADQADALAADIEVDDRTDRLCRHQAACDRTLLRVLDTIRRRHREADAPSPRANRPAETPPSPAPMPVPTTEPGPPPDDDPIATNEPNGPRPDRSRRLAPALALLLAAMIPGIAASPRGPIEIRANEPKLQGLRSPRPLLGTPNVARSVPPSPDARPGLAKRVFPCTPLVL